MAIYACVTVWMLGITNITGSYSRLSCEFYLVRSLGYYIIQIYVPSMLIVVLSWVSFWLSWEAVPARVALGIMTVLTMVTLISSTNASLPKISYLKSIDVYLVICFVMVFGSIIEYAAVSYIGNCWKRHQRDAGKRFDKDKMAYDGSANHESRRRFSLDLPDSPLTEMRLIARRSHSCGRKKSPRKRRQVPQRPLTARHPSSIDNMSRVLFPFVFFAFNILYWAIYLHISARPDIAEILS